jgi:hypothetical protein
MTATAELSHVVVYDSRSSLEVLTLTEAAMYCKVSPAMLRVKIANDELYAQAFWKEGTQYRTSVYNLQKLFAQLGNRNLMQTTIS